MTELRPQGDLLTEDPLRGFETDVPVAPAPTETTPPREDVLEEAPSTGAVVSETVGDIGAEPAPLTAPDPLAVLDLRPAPSAPREYHFPRFDRTRLGNGLTVVSCHLPGRPLLVAQLLVRGDSGGGATTEPPELGGVTVLTARALPEGTAVRNAVELVEASERLGAELSADAGWDSFAASVEMPRSRLAPALALLAEMALEPSFPEPEVERLRGERLNDLKQAKADPRRRIERVFPETIYAPEVPYVRPLAGIEETVARIDRAAVAARHAQLMHPTAATLVLCGDLHGIDVEGIALEAFGAWVPGAEPGRTAPPGGRPRANAPRIVLVDRPGSPQSEVRVGHVGLPRKVPDFHAISVLNTILGGLFNSRLNHLLREQHGYTYGAHSGFDLRRGPGPFAVRCAVHTAVTVPALRDILGELERIREEPVTPDELTMARDYLVGVFPLRFETAAQVTSALGGLIVFELPDDELDNYRPLVAAVTADDVLAAARAHIRPADAAIVVIGDVGQFETELRAAGLGDVALLRDGPVRAEDGVVAR